MNRRCSGHRILEDWSEGPSNPSGSEGGGSPGVAGDVTWVHRVLPDSLWATPGGTFVPSASATLQVADVGSYTFASTSQLVGDVQGWLDDPSTNFGDGETSQEQNPTHTSTTAGTMTVTLVVSNASGDDTVIKEVVVGSSVRRPSRRVAPIP